MNKPTIVVPTYWGSSGENSWADEKIVFDHPTPLDSNGTLTAFLDSLSVLDDKDFYVSIIAVANSPDIENQVLDKVNSIVEPYAELYDISVLHAEKLKNLKNELSKKNISSQSLDLLNLSNYAAVRNICSVAGILNKSDITIFIDDDEVFTDPDFLKKAGEFAGREIDSRKIHAVAGYYLQPDTYKIENKTPPDWTLPFWDKLTSMNKAFDLIIGSGPRLKITPFVFGGNMVVDLQTLLNVPFDPMITRGEDIDFLINLRIAGIDFYLDNKLAIRHLPPPYYRPEWKGLLEDVKRFLYEKKKLEDHRDLPGLKPDDFNPYPGEFLHDDLYERIIKTAGKLREKYRLADDSDGINECDKIIEMVNNNPFADFNTREWMQNLSSQWKELTSALTEISKPGK